MEFNGCVVLVGDAINGHKVYGPYVSFEAAHEIWAYESEPWITVGIEPDDDHAVKVRDCDTPWCKHCQTIQKGNN
jgi:hypothetical protein